MKSQSLNHWTTREVPSPCFDTVLLFFCCGWWWWFGFGEYATPSFILWLLNCKSQVKRNPNLHGDPGCLKRVHLQIIFIVQGEYLEPHRELGWVCYDDIEG